MSFPASPTVGQQATEGGRLYQWTSLNTWDLVANVAGHAASHAAGGSDAVTPASIGAAATSHTHAYSSLTGTPTSFTPSAHASSHAAGGTDALTLTSAQISDFATAAAAAAPATTNASLFTSGTLADARLTANVVLTGDARLTNSRTPTTHASSHAAAGSDPLTLSASQISGLGSLATQNSVAYSSLTGVPSAFAPSSHASSHAAAGGDPLSISASQVSGLASVATSGTYASLTSRPIHPYAAALLFG